MWASRASELKILLFQPYFEASDLDYDALLGLFSCTKTGLDSHTG